MEHFRNKAETFFREIRHIDIHASENYSYQENILGNFPDETEALFRFDVIPEEYERKIPQKKKDGNRFFEVDLSFPLLDMSPETIDRLSTAFNRRGFMVVLHSNTEKTVLGNSREPLTVDLVDGKKDNNSGNDQYNISITGETIINPKTMRI